MAIFKTTTRKISNRGQLKVIVQFFSYKNNASISWESQVERDYFYLLEYADDVVSYLHQPETFQFWVKGIKRSYTPDVRTIHRNGEMKYHEVKFKYSTPGSEMDVRLTAAEKYFQESGYGFDLVDAIQIRKDHLVKNIRSLYRYARWNMENFPMKEVKDFIIEHPQTTVSELLSELSSCPVEGVFRMIYDKAIITDLRSQQLSYASELEVNCL